MDKKNVKLQGSIVQTIQDGKAIIHTCDDFIADTPKEIDRVKKQFYTACWMIARRILAERSET